MRREIEADAEDEVLYSKALTFPEPLDLNKLNEAWDVDIAWTRERANQWAGQMTETERTLYGKITTVTDLETRVISDGLIDQLAVITVNFPRRMAERMGSKEPCVIHAAITHRLR
ncbi:hypothetical protein [Roseobacter fucihabitans]